MVTIMKPVFVPAGVIAVTIGGVSEANCRGPGSQEVRRFGDKSVENYIRTEEHHGHDRLFHGPRGWSYWSYLESPKPIQNSNFWPDTQLLA